jgi:hypothetical protein
VARLALARPITTEPGRAVLRIVVADPTVALDRLARRSKTLLSHSRWRRGSGRDSPPATIMWCD